MRQHAPTDARDLGRTLPDRVMTALTRFRRGGRRERAVRRAAAVLLLTAAAVLASTGRGPGVGTPVLLAARDMDIGTELGPQDVRTATVASAPDGAVATGTAGRVLAAPVRRGEILTDIRFVEASGPRPGVGRAAVPVHIDDSGVAGLLRPGAHVVIVSVSRADVPTTRILTDDAIVLSVADPGGGPLAGGADRVVLVAVPSAVADAVAVAGLTGAIAVRFR